jgi:superfamily II DNA or RNA helicase
VIADECHHIPAVSFERVLKEVRARFVLGLTATAQRRDGHQPILHMQLGPTRFVLDRKSEDAAPFTHELVVRETGFRANVEPLTIQRLYAALASDEARNDLSVADVESALADGRSPLVLTERRDHLSLLANRLRGSCSNVVALRGGSSAKLRREELERLASVPHDQQRAVLATGRYIGEGFDDARLDTLFLALPISWKGTLVQYAGRLSRTYPGKSRVRIVDYVDREVPMLVRMFEKRLRGYRAIGYSSEQPIGNPEGLA